jgi:hypothetical protein
VIWYASDQGYASDDDAYVVWPCAVATGCWRVVVLRPRPTVLLTRFITVAEAMRAAEQHASDQPR